LGSDTRTLPASPGNVNPTHLTRRCNNPELLDQSSGVLLTPDYQANPLHSFSDNTQGSFIPQQDLLHGEYPFQAGWTFDEYGRPCQ
jgi:hypothetical protein